MPMKFADTNVVAPTANRRRVSMSSPHDITANTAQASTGPAVKEGATHCAKPTSNGKTGSPGASPVSNPRDLVSTFDIEHRTIAPTGYKKVRQSETLSPLNLAFPWRIRMESRPTP